MRRTIGLATLTAVVVGISLTPGVASASELEILDPTQVLGKIAPGDLAGSTALEGAVITEAVSGDYTNSQRSDASSAELQVHLNLNAVSDLSQEGDDLEGVLSPDVEISVPFATHKVTTSGTIEVWETAASDEALYVQPLTNGTRFFTVIGGPGSDSTYEYDIDIPDYATMVQDSSGLRFFGEGGTSLGSFQTPWARDAAGQEVPVSYSWNNGTLSQKLDLSSVDATFPVVAQSGWSYSMQWSLESKTVQQNRTNLYNCFNCIFPVAGAPQNFPTYGQDLPLYVPIIPGVNASFHCTMDVVGWIPSTNPRNQHFTWTFFSAPGHVDGPGSSITFNIDPMWHEGSSSTYSSLAVNAWVTNDNPIGIGQPAYLAGAYLNWQKFAFQLRAGGTI